MPGERPYKIIGEVVAIYQDQEFAYAKVDNGNLYVLKPNTSGIDFSRLYKGCKVAMLITSRLEKVYEAYILEDI